MTLIDYDNIYINWVFFSSNNFTDLNPIEVINNTKGIENSVGKSLSKRSSLLKIYDTDNKTMHTPVLKENSTTIKLKNKHLIAKQAEKVIFQVLYVV